MTRQRSVDRTQPVNQSMIAEVEMVQQLEEKRQHYVKDRRRPVPEGKDVHLRTM